MAANNAPVNAKPPKIVHFRHGEVMLLLRPIEPILRETLSQSASPSERPPLDGSTYDALSSLIAGLQRSDGQGNLGLHSSWPLLGQDGQDRRPLPMQRDELYTLLPLNLSSWIQRPKEAVDRGEATLDDFPPSLTDVTDAVTQINDQIEDKGPIRVGRYELVAASPNWLLLGFEDGAGGDSPAGRPRLVDGDSRGYATDRRILRFDPGDVQREVEKGLRALVRVQGPERTVQGNRGKGVKVAIFDTWPVDEGDDGWRQRIRTCLDRSKNSKTPGYAARLEEFLQRTDQMKFHDRIKGSFLEQMPSNHRNAEGSLEPPYLHADHGLFITALIQDIAPEAELLIYRVLNDYGVHDFFTFAVAVEEALHDAGDSPLVLNFSHGFGPELLMIEELFANPLVSYADIAQWTKDVLTELANEPPLDELPRHQQRIDLALAALDGMSLKPARVFYSLVKYGKRFAIASAGNDTVWRGKPAPPRVPAALEGIVGVSATALKDGSGTLASYSCRDDIEAVRDDGVTAFGGEARLVNGQMETEATTGLVSLFVSDDPDGTESLYVTDQPGQHNTTGQAEWSGTSFAAAIVSGLAACIWSEDVNLPAIEDPTGLHFDPHVDLLTAIVRPGEEGNPNHVIGLYQRP